MGANGASRVAGLVVALVVVAASCSSGSENSEVAVGSGSDALALDDAAPTVAGTAPLQPVDPSPTMSPGGSTTTEPARAEPDGGRQPSVEIPRFVWKVTAIGEKLRRRLGPSWRPGCPVGLENLRYVQLTHWGFDGTVHDGELVVHADVVDSLGTAFASLFEQQFSIEQVLLVDDFGGDDGASMAANNTSAFNCRLVAGTSHWSQHAYGRAIDINPVQNPYVRDGQVSPVAGAEYRDRSRVRPGMFIHGGPGVAALTDAGWIWGGGWTSSQDYQHFSTSGR